MFCAAHEDHNATNPECPMVGMMVRDPGYPDLYPFGYS